MAGRRRAWSGQAGDCEHNSPNYPCGGVRLTLDDPEQAERYVRMGRKLEPTNLSTTNDLADYFLEHHSCADAARCYAEVVEESEDSADLEWAELSLIYCRWLMTRDPMELERLVLCAASYPGNPRGAQLCQLRGVLWNNMAPSRGAAGRRFLWKAVRLPQFCRLFR